MNQEKYNEILNQAYTYIWNIMGLGEFSKEQLEKIKAENKTKELFTNFPDEMKILNMEHLLRGYGNFGREYLERVYDQDKASALNMWEAVTQELLDLNAAIQESTQQLQDQLVEKIKEEAEKVKEEN